MTQLETALGSLKEEINAMWGLVTSQLRDAGTCLAALDKNLARGIVAGEKRVNRFELEIDDTCENILALHAPVAIDLRFVLAVLKINANLERTGDIAAGIAKYVLDAGTPFTAELLASAKVPEMFAECLKMLEHAQYAFVHEETGTARGIFQDDEFLDSVNVHANSLIKTYLGKCPADIDHALCMLAIIKKLERVGDQVKNIAEEIVFYAEAKVLKHSNKRYKLPGMLV